MTRFFVLVDIEGVAGVVHSQEGNPGNAEYERARRLMTEEANAAVRGILRADPEARVTVTDTHGPYRNILPEDLDTRVHLLRGKPSPNGMMDGIGPEYDAALFLGVHGRAGTGSSTLSHTFTGDLLDIRLNGTSMGELGLNAAVAGAHGVPVVMVTGDQTVQEEARALLPPEVSTVVVKESRGFGRAESVHPTVARARIEETATHAVQARGQVPPFQVREPVKVEVDVSRPSIADMALAIEGIERVNGRTVRIERPDMLSAYRFLRLMTLLCAVQQ